jgi:triosephosphate isomerase
MYLLITKTQEIAYIKIIKIIGLNKMTNKLLIAGNWKMNGNKKDISFIKGLSKFISNHKLKNVEVLICPPFTLIDKFSSLTSRSSINIGAQDCSSKDSGAYTGEISASMIKDFNGKYCIIGHSERRNYHKETNNLINNKILQAQEKNLRTILCVGETLSDRKNKRTLRVLGNQLKLSLKGKINPNQLDIAYEPVWAIGTGLVPGNSDIEEVHNFIFSKLKRIYGNRAKNIRILYGGSVNSNNISSISSLNNVSGALIGGASLNISDMKSILKQFI